MSPPEKKLSLVNGDRSPPAILQDGNSLSLSLSKTSCFSSFSSDNPPPPPPTPHLRTIVQDAFVSYLKN